MKTQIQQRADERMAEYREQVRETMQSFSDQALMFQAGIIVGGIDREELEREMRRRKLGSFGW